MQALLDVYKIRQDFPILNRILANGKNIIYFIMLQQPKSQKRLLIQYVNIIQNTILIFIGQFIRLLKKLLSSMKKQEKTFVNLLMQDLLKRSFLLEIRQNLLT